MFNKTITNNDNFLEMPDSSQNLYFHLSMNADDDGFVDNWKSIIRMTGHKEDDLKILIAKQYIIPFESGVIVIRHWRLNNYLQKDRITPTNYKEEKALLTTDMNNVYNLDTKCIHSIDKNSIDKNSIDKNINNNSSSSYAADEILKMYEENFGTISSFKAEQLFELEKEYTEKLVIEAMKRCVLHNKRTIAYLKGILEKWKDKTWEEIIDEEKDYEQKKKISKDSTYKTKRELQEERFRQIEEDFLKGENK